MSALPSSVIEARAVAARPAATAVAGSAGRWASRITLSIVDQGLATGAHFLLNVLLARWLAPSEFGAFAIAFSVYLLAWGIHSAVLIEPMSVLGPAYYGGRLSAYLGVAVLAHGVLSAGLAAILVLIAAALAFMGSPLSPAMFAMGFCCPFPLLFWLLRRACYQETRPDLALKGSVAYFFVLLAGMWVLRRYALLGAVHGFLLMGAASLAVSFLFWRMLHVRLDLVRTPAGRTEIVTLIRQHWAQGKWFLRTTILYWLASSVYLPLIGVVSGLESVAGYRAIENLFRPMGQTLTALSVLFLPYASARSEREGTACLTGTAVRTSLLMFLLTGSYVLGILLGGKQLIEFLYGGGHYSRFWSLIPYLGIALILRGIGDNGFAVAAKAARWPDIVFWATLMSAGLTLSTGLYLTYRYGPTGAAAGWALSSVAHVAVTVTLFRSRLNGRSQTPSGLKGECALL